MACDDVDEDRAPTKGSLLPTLVSSLKTLSATVDNAVLVAEQAAAEKSELQAVAERCGVEVTALKDELATLRDELGATRRRAAAAEEKAVATDADRRSAEERCTQKSMENMKLSNDNAKLHDKVKEFWEGMQKAADAKRRLEELFHRYKERFGLPDIEQAIPSPLPQPASKRSRSIDGSKCDRGLQRSFSSPAIPAPSEVAPEPAPQVTAEVTPPSPKGVVDKAAAPALPSRCDVATEVTEAVVPGLRVFELRRPGVSTALKRSATVELPAVVTTSDGKKRDDGPAIAPHLGAKSSPPQPPPMAPPRVVRAEGRAAANAGAQEGGPPCYCVVRNRGARLALQAYDCEQCRNFYNAAGIAPEKRPITAARGKRAASEAQAAEAAAWRRGPKASRHRFEHAPAATPPGFWDLSFPPVEDVPTS